MGSNFSMKIVMDLIFSLLLLGRFFLLRHQDCNTCCKSTLGYPKEASPCLEFVVSKRIP
ncbi:hypothetical protein MKX03_024494 [Papaver bracteatum]|nr:hypothetical protein MKX03_024494 [Papaver bracteatum]